MLPLFPRVLGFPGVRVVLCNNVHLTVAAVLTVVGSVWDPEPDLDPHVFGPPRSGSISQSADPDPSLFS